MATVVLRPSIFAARRRLLGTVRPVHISATPSTTSINGIVDLSSQTQAIPKLSGSGPFPAEIQFEVLGAPYSLLSVALPASSNLYTRRGTLLGLNGDATTASSTLSILSPFTRAPRRIPFLYQKISSPSPLTCIIGTNTPNTTFSVLSLDGTADWTLSQRDALLAWSGHTIIVRASEVTGRGLVALAGRGQVYQVALAPAEEFVVHHRSLLAYSAGGKRPEKARLAAVRLRLQIPKLPRLGLGLRLGERLRDVEWVNAVRASKPWAVLRKALWAVRTAIWADREFLKFVGPATVLLQSRTGGRMRDMLAREEVGEYATVESGMFAPLPKRIETVSVKKTGLETVKQAEKSSEGAAAATPAPAPPSHAGSLKRVLVTKDGKVEFQDSDFKEFIR